MVIVKVWGDGFSMAERNHVSILRYQLVSSLSYCHVSRVLGSQDLEYIVFVSSCLDAQGGFMQKSQASMRSNCRQDLIT